MGADKIPHRVVDLQRGDSRLDHGTSQRPGLGREGPGPAHELDLTIGFDGDHVQWDASRTCLMARVVSSMVPMLPGTTLSLPRS